MKYLFALLIVAFSSTAIAQTPAEINMQTQMNDSMVSYLWSSDGSIAILDNTDPRAICRMASVYGVDVKTVWNVKADMTVNCQTSK
jgi:hypothetical protein